MSVSEKVTLVYHERSPGSHDTRGVTRGEGGKERASASSFLNCSDAWQQFAKGSIKGNVKVDDADTYNDTHFADSVLTLTHKIRFIGGSMLQNTITFGLDLAPLVPHIAYLIHIHTQTSTCIRTGPTKLALFDPS